MHLTQIASRQAPWKCLKAWCRPADEV